MGLPLPITNPRVPTDLEILELIYRHYYLTFAEFVQEKPTRRTKNYVPIDIEAIANELVVDKDVIHGRLYYHLDKKYGHRPKGEPQSPFFEQKFGEDSHCVHFPMLISVLAELQEQHRRVTKTLRISIGSLVVAIFSLGLSVSAVLLRLR